MRILSGRYKGRQVKTIQNSGYRPTQSKIRKSLFDILGNLDNSSFLDLYAGSGIVGFEASSRGAKKVSFVEKESIYVQLLRQNARHFENQPFNIYKQSVLTFLKGDDNFDIIFADPPYHSNELFELVKLALEHLSKNGRFILETRKETKLPLGANIRTYGDTHLNIWTR